MLSGIQVIGNSKSAQSVPSLSKQSLCTLYVSGPMLELGIKVF